MIPCDPWSMSGGELAQEVERLRAERDLLARGYRQMRQLCVNGGRAFEIQVDAIERNLPGLAEAAEVPA